MAAARRTGSFAWPWPSGGGHLCNGPLHKSLGRRFLVYGLVIEAVGVDGIGLKRRDRTEEVAGSSPASASSMRGSSWTSATPHFNETVAQELKAKLGTTIGQIAAPTCPDAPHGGVGCVRSAGTRGRPGTRLPRRLFGAWAITAQPPSQPRPLAAAAGGGLVGAPPWLV